MEHIFKERNILLRAVCPKSRMPQFWKADGSLSSAAFKKKDDGLSISCTNLAHLEESIYFMVSGFIGQIVSVTVQDCESVNAFLIHLPTTRDPYHGEIRGSKECKTLSNYQARVLAQKAILRSQGRE